MVRGFGGPSVLRAPAAPSARPRRVLGRVVVAGLGVSFLKRSLRGNARARGRLLNGRPGRRHGPCFSALAKNGAVKALERWETERNQLRARAARPWRGPISLAPGGGQRERSLALTQRIPAGPARGGNLR